MKGVIFKMNSKSFNVHNKLIVLKHAEKTQNVKETCELFEISRTTYYKWLSDYERDGEAGLETKAPKKPKMPNRVPRKIEQDILHYVSKYPKDGPRQIYYELKSLGIEVGETGIFNVLKRHDLTQRSKRIAYSFRQKIVKERVVPRQQCLLEDADTPGYIVIQGMRLVGNFPGCGKVYQYCIYDVASQWAMVKLFNSKRDIDLWQPFESKFMYLLRTFKLTVSHMVIVKEKNFLPYFLRGDWLKNASVALGCQTHYLTPDDEMLTAYHHFHTMLNQHFFDKIMSHRSYDSIESLEKELNQFMRKYNFFKPIEAGIHKGMTPGETILRTAIDNDVNIDTLPIWMNALIETAKMEQNREQANIPT